MTTENKILPTIEELVAHMKQHKDAVIIIGDKIASDYGKKFNSEISENPNEETEEEKILNRKNMVKNPSEFWSYYFDNIYYDERTMPGVYEDIYSLDHKGLVKTIISTDIRHAAATVADINLRGVSTIITCSKCGHALCKEEITNVKNSKEYKCPECGGRLKPECLLYKEKYYQKDTDAIKEALFNDENPKLVLPNTHTLILLGIDTQEDYLLELYESFLAVRNNTEEQVFVVMATDKEEDVLLFTPEFATMEDIDGSISRLAGLFND